MGWEVQKMCFSDEQPKGLKQVLEERGVDASRMNGNADFVSQKSLLEEKIESRGHLCLFFQNSTVN